MSKTVENLSCPACGHLGLDSFFEARSIPVHSTRLLRSREEVARLPTGDLKLAFCPACEFVHNFAFDPSLLDYSGQCEESQAFSPRFETFLKTLTEGLIGRYDIRGKSVLEIGCGKGDFLELICELGGNSGVGIDPGGTPYPGDAGPSGRTHYIRDFYGPRYAHLRADIVCCRHTLEHIGPVRAFLDLLRRSIGDRPTLLFLEVPDVERVLNEAAFWDVYYEHCSYFSSAALTRLLQACGFEVLESNRAYDDQYLTFVARAARLPVSTPVESCGIGQAARLFEARVADIGARWRAFIQQRRAAGRRIVLWGSSSKGVAFLTSLQVGEGIEAVVDINPRRQGHFMPGAGHEIIAPASLPALRPDTVIVTNPIYLAEISAELRALGLDPELTAL